MKKKPKIVLRKEVKKAVKPRSPLPSVRLPIPIREVSVMAWIEDHWGNVLLVKQTAGKRSWTFPGGKVRSKETLLNALKRELREEVGLIVDVASPVDIFDRVEKSNLTILYRVILKPKSQVVTRKGEIHKYAFLRAAPRLSTPCLQYFWARAQRSFEPLTVIG